MAALRLVFLSLLIVSIHSPIMSLAEGEAAPSPLSEKVTTLSLDDPESIAAARATAEQYWNAQKTSDEAAFRAVTPHDNMNIVFDWSYVNQSAITVEKGPLSPIHDDLASCIEKKQRSDSLPTLSPERMPLFGEILRRADRVATHSPMLGAFLKKGYWETIVPPSILEAKQYELMHYHFIVNVEFQSRAGTTLERRVATMLRRVVADPYDSGWKVLFVPGL